MNEGAGCGRREGAVVRFWFILKVETTGFSDKSNSECKKRGLKVGPE